jgi:hypothetical protein
MVSNIYRPVRRPFPPTFKLGRKAMVKGSEFENYKLSVAADAAGLPPPQFTPPPVETFKTLDVCATEMGIDRRTLDRLIHATRIAGLSTVAAE